MNDSKTATRVSLSDAWKERQKLVDWMHAPTMPEYVNRLVSGTELAEGGHWAIYARDKFLKPLAERQGELSMLSLACGSAHVDGFLVDDLEWPIAHYVGVEYDSQLLGAARERFASIEKCTAEFHRFDFNNLDRSFGRFDVVFTCHSIHHCTDLEALLTFINGSLKPGGIVIGIDYFGPTRFQLEPEVQALASELFALLPSHLRQNLTADGQIDSTFKPPTIAEVRAADPSESIRSSDLRTLLFSNFPIIEVAPMGGTILRWLLQNRAGNFDADNESDLCILGLLQLIEQKSIESRLIRSDDLFFVLGPSETL